MNEKNLWRKKKQSKGTKKILKLCKLKKFELKKMNLCIERSIHVLKTINLEKLMPSHNLLKLLDFK